MYRLSLCISSFVYLAVNDSLLLLLLLFLVYYTIFFLIFLLYANKDIRYQTSSDDGLSSDVEVIPHMVTTGR